MSLITGGLGGELLITRGLGEVFVPSVAVGGGHACIGTEATSGGVVGDTATSGVTIGSVEASGVTIGDSTPECPA